jgi:Domain of unknown function (DUF4157)
MDAREHSGFREQDGEADAGARRRPAATPLQRLASAVGNVAFARFARSGAGLLPDGSVHPDVEAAIGAARGGGSALDAGVRGRVAAALGDDLADVRVHADEHADHLSRAVAARAFTTGADVFFARGEYRPGTAAGDQLLAHELAHVVQQRGAPASGPLTVTDPAGALEAEAEAVADDLAGG